MPNTAKQTDPRQRIIEAAIDLFYLKGYSATGIRELGQAATVNSAMINYYFGSKEGLLKEIITDFFKEYRTIIQSGFNLGGGLEEKIHSLAISILGFFMQHPKTVRIFFTENPSELPEIAQYKAALITEMRQALIPQLASVVPFIKEDPHIFLSMGPAIASIMASHFLLKPVLENMNLAASTDPSAIKNSPDSPGPSDQPKPPQSSDLPTQSSDLPSPPEPPELNETFYKKMPQIIADMMVGGITLVSKNALTGKYQNL